MVNFVLPQTIKNVMETIHKAGGYGFVVGGAVRDLLLGRKPANWDITATLKKEELMELFPNARLSGRSHETLQIPSNQGICNISPSRTEASFVQAGVSETLSFKANIFVDLWRRDFTVNAMAYDGTMLIDPFGGQEDLKARTLRCVGDAAERFREDPIRVMRLFRLSAVLGMQIAPDTLSAALNHADLLSTLGNDKVRIEVYQILMSERPQTLGVLIAKGMLSKYGFAFAPSLAVLEKVPKEPLCRWWALITLCGADASTVGRAFGFSLRHTDELYEATRLYQCGAVKSCIDLKEKLRDTRLDYGRIVDAYAAIAPGYAMEPAFFGQVQRSREPYRVKDLAVDGNVLLCEGIDGKLCDRVLNELLSVVIKNPALNRKSVLLGLARSLRQQF